MTEGYWDCDTCTFTDIAGVEIQEPSDNLMTTGVGLVCGAAGIFVLWVLVKATYMICPGTASFQNVQTSEHSDDWITQTATRTKRFDARRWARSKQWTSGSPIPEAFARHDEDDDYYNKDHQQDGLEKIEENGVTRKEQEEDDAVPDYWLQWKEQPEAGPF